MNKPHIRRAYGGWVILPSPSAQPTSGTILYRSVRHIGMQSLVGARVLAPTTHEGYGVMLL